MYYLSVKSFFGVISVLSISTIQRVAIKISVISSVYLLAACASTVSSTEAGGVFDPFEKQNRKIHAFNRGLDKALVRPAARGYSALLPDPIEDSIGNFAENLGQPSGAGLSTTRFLTNTVLGFAGFVDAAAEFKVPEHSTDFGETLYTWGAGEGAYVELPALGPSTVRNTTGKVVDLFTNPLSYAVNSPDKYYGTAASVASRLSDRGRYGDTIDSILYESADSYAQARLIYLQNRRFGLGDETANVSTDPYSDPYEDPYAQ